MNLNTEQKQAVQHFQGPVLVTAGPGSGKTAVIVSRIKNLTDVCHVSPRDILTVTFTKAAASQMEERFMNLSGYSCEKPVFGTFHSIFFNMLKLSGFGNIRIITEKEKRFLIRSELEKYIPDRADSEELLSETIGAISCFKNSVKPDRLRSEQYYSQKAFPEIYKAYCHALSLENRMDFDDIVINTLKMLKSDPGLLKYWQERFRYIQIDEFQDINDMQYQTILLLAGTSRNIFAVGDADQSIYGFRGSSPAIMERFLSDFPECRHITLGINYRCPETILLPCFRLISRAPGQRSAFLSGAEKNGDPCFEIAEFNDQKEQYRAIADKMLSLHDSGTAYPDMAVLLRSNTDISLISGILSSSGIPCPGSQSSPDIFRYFAVTDIICYLKAAKGIATRKEFLRIVNRPSRFISANALPQDLRGHVFDHLRKYYSCNPHAVSRINRMESDLKFLASLSPAAAVDFILKGIGYASFLRQSPSSADDDRADPDSILKELKNTARNFRSADAFLEFAARRQSENTPNQPRAQENSTIHILTMHTSKGLEFNTVFLPDLNNSVIPSSHARDESSVHEERRLLYVAMTRSSHRLYLSYCRFIHDKRTARSVFIDEILMPSS